MPLLVCSAMSCIYNRGEYCSKGDITVGGKEAGQPEETCCESFMARRGNEVTDSAGVPSATIHVGCKACHCQYNEEQCCTASMVLLRKRKTRPSAERSVAAVENKK